MNERKEKLNWMNISFFAEQTSALYRNNPWTVIKWYWNFRYSLLARKKKFFSSKKKKKSSKKRFGSERCTGKRKKKKFCYFYFYFCFWKRNSFSLSLSLKVSEQTGRKKRWLKSLIREKWNKNKFWQKKLESKVSATKRGENSERKPQKKKVFFSWIFIETWNERTWYKILFFQNNEEGEIVKCLNAWFEFKTFGRAYLLTTYSRLSEEVFAKFYFWKQKRERFEISKSKNSLFLFFQSFSFGSKWPSCE